MSINDERIVAPWVGTTSSKNALSVVILSTNADIIQNISEALREVHDEGSYRWKLIILKSFYLDEIVKQTSVTGEIGIDFVILGLDTSSVLCLQWANKVLSQVHPDLRIRRVVLVNASGLPANAMAISVEDLIDFQTGMELDLITANVFDREHAIFLGQRLLKYIEVSIGVKTGIPNLNV